MSRLSGGGRLEDGFGRRDRFESRFTDNDRFKNRFEQNRLESQVEEPELRGSTRLADRPQSQFQLRELFREQQRARVDEGRGQFADALDLQSGQVSAVQLDDRGESFGFVPNESGRDELASDFAAGRPFVEPDEALVDADAREGVQTRTDPAAKDTIASRARQETADETDFVESDDLDAEVGPGGVESVGLTDTGARRRAGRQFEAETPLTSVDAGRDVRADGDSFTLTEPAQRRFAARGFESELDTFGRGELDPSSDIRDTNGGFGLSRDATREVAADQLDDQLSDTTVRPGDIELDPLDSGGFEAVFER